MSTEHFKKNEHTAHLENDKQPHWRKKAAGFIAAVALFNMSAPSAVASSETPEPTPTSTTAAPFETNPTPGSSETTPTPTTEAPQETTITTNTKLRVRTANVTGKHMDGFKGNGYDKRPYYGTWAERDQALLGDIEKQHPDIIGLQEVDAGTQSSTIHSSLLKHSYETQESNYANNSRPIYWDKNTFDLVKGGTFSLKDTDRRRASYAILYDIATKQEMIILNAHYKSALDAGGRKDRKTAAHTIADMANKLSKGGQIPVFFTGDLNSDIGDSPYDILKASKADNGARLVEAHTQTTNRIHYEYNSANMYYKYTSKGSTKGQPSHMVIDQGWYYKTVKNNDGTVINVRTEKTYNDLPTIVYTNRHGAVRSTDHNPQTFTYNIETAKPFTG